MLALIKLNTEIKDTTNNTAEQIVSFSSLALTVNNEWLYNVGSMALAGAIMFANKDGWYNAMQEAQKNAKPKEEAQPEEEGEAEEEVVEEAALHSVFNL